MLQSKSRTVKLIFYIFYIYVNISLVTKKVKINRKVEFELQLILRSKIFCLF